MEHFENNPWYNYSDHSGGEMDEDNLHDRHLAKVRSRSNSHSRNRNSFLVDELDMLMDKAATTIQAAWRGYLVRKRRMTENKAACTIQKAWKHFITREYMMQQDQVPSWRTRGHRRRTPSPASMEDGRQYMADGRQYMEDRRQYVESHDMSREEAATVIQAHYRGYRTRRFLSQCNQATFQSRRRHRHAKSDQTYASRAPRKSFGGDMDRVPLKGGIFPRSHWKKVMVGTPDEWRTKVPNHSYPEEEYTEPSPEAKSCPKCGRCTTVRVLEGVGKGPPCESEADDSEYEETPAAFRARRRSSGSTEESPRRQSVVPHVSYQMGSQSSEDQPRRSSVLNQRQALHPLARPTKERATNRSLSSTSIHQQGPPPSAESSDWLYENFCAHRMGEGQRRVFKTRKQMWEVSRAATCIQAHWRGYKVRQVLRRQEEAAIRIQSAYRGYKTRVYLIDAGILSDGDTD